MKKHLMILCLMSIRILAFSVHVYAQTNDDSLCRKKSHWKEDKYFTIGYIGAGLLSNPKNDGALSISFPYTTKDINGNISQATYSSTSSKNFYRFDVPIYLFFNLEIGNASQFINENIAFDPISNGMSLTIGYGHILYIDKWLLSDNKYLYKSEKTQKGFSMFKPSLNFTYNYLDSKLIGSINSQNLYIYILQQTANPTFMATVSKVTSTYNSQKINIYYRQNNFDIAPKISFCNNSLTKFYHIEFNASVLIPFAQNGRLDLEQTGTNNAISTLGIVKLNSAGLNIRYDNKSIKTTPYKFPGICISTIVGLNGNARNKKTKSHRYSYHPTPTPLP